MEAVGELPRTCLAAGYAFEGPQEPVGAPSARLFLQWVLEELSCFLRAGHRLSSSVLSPLPLPPSPTVIDGLDLLKKEHPGARDGIRYLEAEFKKGNR